MIRKTSSGFKVISHKGKNLSAPNLTLGEAKLHLHQIEYFKHKTRKK